MTFRPNWIWRELVVVEPRTPAFFSKAPVASKIELLLPSVKKFGAAKFV
jgi:hypothetical protein